jgi:hypothetical protein
MSNKQIKFSAELIEPILNGQKTSTWRLFDDKNLTTGDIIDFIRRPELTVFAKAELTSIIEKPLGKLDSKDLEGHEAYDSRESLYQNFAKLYKKEVGPDTLAKIVKFKLLSKV